VYTYHHENREHACCGEHQISVRHRMEAMGRIGPYVSDPVEFRAIPQPELAVPDWRGLAERYKAEAESLREQLAEELTKREHAEGEIGVLTRKVDSLKRELDDVSRVMNG
jgi:hypothetical protein